MPLSEHEQRQLEQIEQALYADYPKLAQAVRAKDPRVHYKRRMLEAVAGFLVGVGALLAGVIYSTRFFPWIAVGGFVVMLACVMWGLNSWRHMGGTQSGRGVAGRGGARGRGQARRGGARGRGQARRGRATGATFMERMEERWRRRQQGEG